MTKSYRYSHHARRALTHAAALAEKFQHPYQDTGHLLVGVVLAEGSVGAQVMKDLDLPVPVAQVYLKRLMEPVESITPPIPHDRSLDQALEQAADEASWLGTHYVGTEHLLLGITRTNLGNAIKLLRLVEITPEQVRRRVRHSINDSQGEFSLETVRANARLSELSRRVLNAAEQLAVSLDHPTVGLGHLLLALIRERRGVTSGILRRSNLDEQAIQKALDARDRELLVSIEFVLPPAIDLAEKLGNHYVGADHLLLTLTTIPAGIALLQFYGASPEKINRLLNKHLRDDSK